MYRITRACSVRLAIALAGGVVSLTAPYAASAATVQISATDTGFSPQTMYVNPGDTIVWTNTGSSAQTVTSDTSIFSSGTLSAGQSFTYTFPTSGSYRYYSANNGGPNGVGQSGTIVVNGSIQPATTYVNASSASLQQQVQALLNQVNQLQQQYGGTSGTGTGSGSAIGAYNSGTGTGANTGARAQGSTGAGTSRTSASASAASCPNIGRVLKKGSSGDDVSRLQQFFAQDPSVYPEGLVTGYYGAMTEKAVQAWQAKNNIVSSGTAASTGYGVVGPRTAAAIALLCAQGSSGSGTGSDQAGGFIQVSPVSGNAPLVVNVQANVNTTNSCQAINYQIDWGDNSSPIQIPVGANVCQTVSQPYSHTYQTPGTYQIVLSAGSHRTTAQVTVYGGTQATQSSSQQQSSQSQQTTSSAGAGSTQTQTTVHNGTGSANNLYGPLAITPAVGGDSMTVNVQFGAGGCNSFALDWGDGTQGMSHGNSCTADSGSGAAQSYTHTYQSNGMYIITLRRGPNLTYTDTASIALSN